MYIFYRIQKVKSEHELMRLLLSPRDPSFSRLYHHTTVTQNYSPQQNICLTQYLFYHVPDIFRQKCYISTINTKQPLKTLQNQRMIIKKAVSDRQNSVTQIVLLTLMKYLFSI
ncbi:hypothetical protein TTHERM_000036879 (macronuclear) [Tetrahymena thermophila SB210]|uniref:Uncharacterized protein n=1 Tax=Tetrahymena thermophila (strain SB210) TaxID=312017 RepID=W7XIT1_TETTS|nr:hypothetical protein TTHERM_000036879 [Tetrahymena thermophila SB210]EWS74886.1 hypothetical protein TTHERM_000036879 [Tetrahymena thermophila SB210]|eukprot:XP_012652599.1 hypothetical protein TTHERM_000036879 [Tetrahymena thermophila SB210]